VDVKSSDYNQDVAAFSTAEQPIYEPQLKAAQSFYAPLYMNRVRETYAWTVDIISQVIFSTNAEVQFEILVGKNKADLTNHNINGTLSADPLHGLHVSRLDTVDLWNMPVPQPIKPLHVVVLTHGLHSNVSADLLFLKEKLDEKARLTGENLIVRGYCDNVCKTEKGIKFLGRRLGDYIMKELMPSLTKSIASQEKKNSKPIKISFIGHSLGGLVQTFALAHIHNSDPEFFNNYKPENFICLACPFLGISNENPGYIKMALDLGFVGKSGQDLGLTWKPGTGNNKKPLLQILPSGPTHVVLDKFRRLTLYANAVNDGIVPLRTSAILYLDWRAISEASQKEGVNRTAPPPKVSDEMNRRHAKERKYSNRSESDDINADTTDITDNPLEEPEEFEEPKEPEEPELKTTEIPEARENDEGSVCGPTDKSDVKQSAGDFFSSLGAPLQSFVAFIAPQAAKKPPKIYHRSQILSRDDDEETVADPNTLSGIPKKTSMIESGVSVIIPPLPSANFINDPSSRPETIFHDRFYQDSELPPRHFVRRGSSVFSNLVKRRSSASSSSTLSSPTDESVPTSPTSEIKEKSKVEEKIAREWHRSLKWRKVLVQLEPDAHNNIIVRRRFANAYGWPVIDHLVNNHFPNDSGKPLPTYSTIDILRNSFDSRADKEPRDSEDLTNFRYEEKDDDVAEESEVDEEDVPARNIVKKRSSAASGWKSHLMTTENDSDDEGIVHSMGGIIDSFRDFGSLNYQANREPDQSVEPLEQDTLEERVNRVL
jgi:hypothetical protein